MFSDIVILAVGSLKNKCTYCEMTDIICLLMEFTVNVGRAT